MIRPWRRPPPRPFYKSLIDGLVFAAALLFIAVLLKWFGLLQAETGLYVAIDGDSLRRNDSDIRLYGIDAPELHQTCSDAEGRDYRCGLEARRALADLVAGRDLNCVVEDQDRYGRSVAQCNAGAVDVNAAMVRAGWAIAYRRHSRDYVDEEDAARRSRRGLWQGTFDNPAAWREAHRIDVTRGDLGE